MLLFQHSVDVLAADAAARIAVFERRVAMQNETDAAAASSNEQRPNEPTPSRLGRPSVPSSAGALSPDKQVPDSQDSDVVPESPDAAGTPSQKQPPPVDLNARELGARRPAELAVVPPRGPRAQPRRGRRADPGHLRCRVRRGERVSTSLG